MRHKMYDMAVLITYALPEDKNETAYDMRGGL